MKKIDCDKNKKYYKTLIYGGVAQLVRARDS